jgi:hypothetical protein
MQVAVAQQQHKQQQSWQHLLLPCVLPWLYETAAVPWALLLLLLLLYRG